eukprot:TRINITY_DN1032_c0_g1_i2.p1 TRINITY_DN1032_c0_g1~~TRINITY_DN1032_c0_g1_i2.p1  ORF type:complete len:437 (-),score=89.54 TRINITY_DN1032_c0_g1_i2:18-1328(-)
MIKVLETIPIFGSVKHPKCTIPLSENDITMPKVYTRWISIYHNLKNDRQFMRKEDLISSLSTLLNEYYYLNAHLKDKEYSVHYDPENLRSVQFSVCESDIVLEEWRKQKFEQKSIPIGFAPDPKANEEDPVLFAVNYTTLKGGNLVLGFAAHHWVTDGAGIANFVENWGRRTRGVEIKTPVLDRSLLQPTEDDPVDDHWEYLISEKIPQAFFELPPTSELTSQRFFFSPEKLKALKSKVEKEIEKSGSSGWVSTNDCLMALVWRTVSRARELKGDNEIKFGFAVNGRLRWPTENIENYFGNFNLFGCARSTPHILLSSPLSAIALLFRDAVNIMDPKRAQSAINFVHRIKDKSTLYPSFVGRGNYSATNWTRFPFYTDFGWGVPEKIFIPANKFDGLFIVLPTPQKDCFEIVLGAEEKNLPKILSDPEFMEFAELS